MKTPIQSAGEAVAESKLETHLIDLEDFLGEVSSFSRAVFMAADSLSDSANTCAMQVLSSQISSLLEKARCVIDEIRRNAE